MFHIETLTKSEYCYIQNKLNFSTNIEIVTFVSFIQAVLLPSQGDGVQEPAPVSFSS